MDRRTRARKTWGMILLEKTQAKTMEKMLERHVLDLTLSIFYIYMI